MAKSLSITMANSAELTFEVGKFSAPSQGNYLEQLVKNGSGNRPNNSHLSRSTPYGWALEFYDRISIDPNTSNVTEKKLREDAWRRWGEFAVYIALSKLRGVDLTFLKVDMPNLGNSATGIKAHGLELMNHSALKLPSVSPGGDSITGADWGHVYLILANGVTDSTPLAYDVVIGITSPYTLLCPNSLFKPLEDLSDEEKQAAVNWLNEIDKGKQTIVRRLVDDAIMQLGTAAESGVSKDYFTENGKTFTIASNDPFSNLNFAVRKRPAEADWDAFFAALALNDIRGLDINLRNGLFYASSTVLTEVYDLTGIAPRMSFSELRDMTANLSAFEKQCVGDWLIMFIKNAHDNEINNEIKKKALDFLGRLQPNNIVGGTLNVAPKPNNRFFTFDDSSSLAFYVHKRNYAFFEGTGAYAESVRRGWLNVLTLLALRKIKGINIRFDKPASMDTVCTPKNDANEGLFKEISGIQRHVLKFEDKDDKGFLAVSSCATLIELCDGAEEIAQKLLKGIRTEMYEKALLGNWFAKTASDIEGDDKLIDREHRDCGYIVSLLRTESEALLKDNGAKKTIDELSELFEFSSPDDIFKDKKSAAKHLNNTIDDGLFQDTLYLTETQIASDPMRSGENDKTKSGIYSILHDSEGSPGGLAEEGNLFAIIPFTEKAARWFYENIGDINNGAAKTSGRAGLPSTKTLGINSLRVRQLINDNGETIGDYEICLNKDGTEIIKPYSKSQTKNVGKIVPPAQIYCDAEIQGFSAYALSTAIVSSAKDYYFELCPPSFMYTGDNAHPAVNIIDYEKEESSELYVVSTVTMPAFPWFLSVKNENEHIGYVMPKPAMPKSAISKENSNLFSFIKKSDNSEVTIGIDLGTTNSVAYVRLSKENTTVFSFDNASGITATTPISPAEVLAEIAQSPMNDSSVMFPTIFSIYGDRNRPFEDGNVFRLHPGKDMASDHSVLLRSQRIQRGFKWDSGISEDRLEILFTQVAEACCIDAIKKNKAVFGKLTLHISFPTSLSLDMHRKYKDVWARVQDNLLQTFGFKEKPAVYFFSESVCVALSVEENRFQRITATGISGGIKPLHQTGFVCVDIGGGTTDIAFVQGDPNLPNEAIVAHLSLPFAGRRLISGALLNEHIKKGAAQTLEKIVDGLLNQAKGKSGSLGRGSAGTDMQFRFIFGDNDDKPGNVPKGGLLKAVTEAVKKTDASRTSEIEFYGDLLVSYISRGYSLINPTGNLQDSLQSLLINNVAPEDSYLSRLKFGCCALFYFVGLCVAKLCENKRLENRFVNGANLSVLLSGNGVGVLDYIRAGRENGITLNNIAPYVVPRLYFEEGLKHGGLTNVTTDFARSMPQYRKHEVAYGLTKAEKAHAVDAVTGGETFVPDIDSLVGIEDINDLKLHIETLLKNAKISESKIASVKEKKNVKEMIEAARNCCNPTYGEDAQKKLIGEFLKVFYHHSNIDFKNVFNKSIDYEADYNAAANAALRKMVNVGYTSLKNDDSNLFKLKSANEFAVIAFANAVVCGFSGE